MSKDLGQMEFDTPDRIGNTQIMYLADEIDRVMMHLSRCPSATTNDLMAADHMVMAKFLENFKGWFTMFSSQPRTYMPNAAPKPKPLTPPDPIGRVQCSIIQYWLNELNTLRTQLLYSEDAEYLSGFNDAAVGAVYMPWMTKMEQSVTEAGKAIPPEGDAWLTFKPDTDLQKPGVNPGSPR